MEIAKRNNCPVIGSVELISCLKKVDSSLQGHKLGIGGSDTFDFGKVRLTKAFHGGTVQVGNEEVGICTPTGIVLTMGGKSLYHPGDTDVFGDMSLIGMIDKIDVAALPIGDYYTMGIDGAVLAADLLKADKYFPMHYNTFAAIQQDDQVWLGKMQEKGHEAVIIPVNGELEV